MARVEVKSQAPDFSLSDIEGNRVGLADFVGRKHVLLVFNRGFV